MPGLISDFVINRHLVPLLFTLAIIYLCLDVVQRRRKMVDKDGNPIPNGPTGIPILGSFLYLFFSVAADS
jgi:hypothetical protein